MRQIVAGRRQGRGRSYPRSDLERGTLSRRHGGVEVAIRSGTCVTSVIGLCRLCQFCFLPPVRPFHDFAGSSCPNKSFPEWVVHLRFMIMIHVMTSKDASCASSGVYVGCLDRNFNAAKCRTASPVNAGRGLRITGSVNIYPIQTGREPEPSTKREGCPSSPA